jgi:hypothetical protein
LQLCFGKHLDVDAGPDRNRKSDLSGCIRAGRPPFVLGKLADKGADVDLLWKFLPALLTIAEMPLPGKNVTSATTVVRP